jgi:tetratricopeptide (TPR) repeat protein
VSLAIAGASREEADAFLRDQRRLVALQARELSHELDLRHWSLWVRHLSGVLKLTFEVGLAVVAAGLACFIGAAVWNAAHAEGLVIEPFSVPPDLAARGITGQVVASQMLDQLTIMQTSTQSARPGRAYASSWGDDLKVEIPETGVSIGEAYRFLRRWLGHETHIDGEVVRTATGIAITARIGGNSGTTFRGPDADLDALIVNSAERIYRIAQPDRYARYIFFPRPGLAAARYDEARAILNQMAREAPPVEKYWAWTSLGILARFQGDYRATAAAYRNAAASANPVATAGGAIAEAYIGHPEHALSVVRATQHRLESGPVNELDGNFVAIVRNGADLQLSRLLGDYQAAADQARQAAARSDALTVRESPHAQLIHILALLHDGAGARAYWQGLPPTGSLAIDARRTIARARAEGELGHYQAMIAMAPDVEKASIAAATDGFIARDSLEIYFRPFLALARARTGDHAGAQALIAATPLDCYDCLRMRALIAEQTGQRQEADAWFARAVRDAPSIPFAYADWGQVLLQRGHPDAAIEKFKLSSKKGPHFADPLEGWGEALMARNQSHLALEKFASANKYAPNWGRLHLKWGQALVYVGKPAEAKAQFARAAALDLTSSEKAELAARQS